MYLTSYLEVSTVFLVVQVGKPVHKVIEDAVKRRKRKPSDSLHAPVHLKRIYIGFYHSTVKYLTLIGQKHVTGVHSFTITGHSAFKQFSINAQRIQHENYFQLLLSTRYE